MVLNNFERNMFFKLKGIGDHNSILGNIRENPVLYGKHLPRKEIEIDIVYMS